MTIQTRKSRSNLRRKLLSAWIGSILAPLAIPAVQADSGAGVDTTLGNTLNPRTLGNVQIKDPEGRGEAPYSRNPTGFLYDWPNRTTGFGRAGAAWFEGAFAPATAPEDTSDEEKPADADAKTTYFRGHIEIGVIDAGGDEDRAKFREYKDLDDGLYIPNLGLSWERDTSYLDIVGGGIGRDDQYYGLTFGRYNDWRIKGFYNETPHVFTTTYRSLWNGLGTDELTLRNLTPGGTTDANTTQAAIRDALANTDDTELALLRQKGGARLDMRLSERWRFFFNATQEKREGTRPFGAVFGGGGGGGNIEIAESIDYITQDMMTGFQFADELSSFNVQASISLFRNDIDTLTFDNPLFINTNTITGVPPTTFTQGQIDLYPDNEYYNLKGEYARRLPNFYDGRFTGVVSLSTMRQNDDLIPWTRYSLTGGAINGVPTDDNWNTPAALTKQSADARIDTRLVDIGLALRPLSDLDVKGKIRYYETKNRTEFWACNPLTGQWGRLLNNGSGGAFVFPHLTAGVNPDGTTNTDYNAAGCNLAATQALGLVPSAGNVNLRNIPYEYKQYNYTVSADYRLSRNNSVNAAIERETFKREYRERDETWENKFKLGYVNRSLARGTARLSLEHDRRRGSDYSAHVYHQFYSAALGPTPETDGVNVASWIHVIEQFRKFDVADRDQNIFNGRFNYALTSAVDAGMTVQIKDARYPAEYGRRDHQRQNSLSLDVNWQPSPTLGVFGFYSYQDGRMKQRGNRSNACVLGTTYYFWSTGEVTTTSDAPGSGSILLGTSTPTAADWENVCAPAGTLSPLFPNSRAWEVTHKDRNDVFGVGMRYDFDLAAVNLSFTRAYGRTSIDYVYNPIGQLMTETDAALAGSGFEDLTFSQNIFEAILTIPVRKTTAVDLLYRYESAKIDDWHYNGVRENPMPASNAVYLDAGPEDYRAHVVGVMVRADF